MNIKNLLLISRVDIDFNSNEQLECIPVGCTLPASMVISHTCMHLPAGMPPPTHAPPRHTPCHVQSSEQCCIHACFRTFYEIAIPIIWITFLIDFFNSISSNVMSP